MKLKNIILATACILSLTMTPVLAKESVKKPKVIHLCKKDDTAVNILACNVYMEGRGEKLDGQLAIAFVTLNRLKQEKFPTTIKHVVFQKNQFSWVGVSTKVTEREAWEKSKEIAKFVYSLKDKDSLYEFVDPTNGSLYYHRKGAKPIWRHLLKKEIIIGSHIFYTEKTV